MMTISRNLICFISLQLTNAVVILLLNCSLSFAKDKIDMSETTLHLKIFFKEAKPNDTIILTADNIVMTLSDSPRFKFTAKNDGTGHFRFEIKVPDTYGYLTLSKNRNYKNENLNGIPIRMTKELFYEPGDSLEVSLSYIENESGIGGGAHYLNTRLLDNVNGEELILLAIEDITDKRKIEEGLATAERLLEESKERLKLAVEATELGVWEYNPLTGKLSGDKRAKTMFGFSTEAELDYAQFISVIYPDDRDQVAAYLKQALVENTHLEYIREFRILRKDDQLPVWIRLKGQVFFNSNGVIDRFIGSAMDITVEKSIEQKTLELLKQKDDFISIASHELKTPVTALSGALQLLDRMKADTSAKMLPTLIERANKSLNKINMLITDLLNASRFNNGQLQLNKSWVMLSELIEDCCPHVRAEGIYSIIVRGKQDIKIYVDVPRIEQVIVNFVNNAIKYAPNSKEILISVEEINDKVKVAVSDKGPGIAEDQIPFLFDRYFQVKSDGTPYSGLGLGLYISSEIIRRHQGQIGVNSEVGNGARFWFIIPKKPEKTLE